MTSFGPDDPWPGDPGRAAFGPVDICSTPQSRVDTYAASPWPRSSHCSSITMAGSFGAIVPIHRLLEPGVFQPEEVAALAHVFDDVLHTLGLVDRTDRVTTLVAKKVIELAQTGERDADRLKQLTIEAFRGRANQNFDPT